MTGPEPDPEVTALEVLVVPGLPEVSAGDDVGRLIARACTAAGIVLRDDDVVTVASKVVAKAEGRTVPAADRDAAVAAETVRVVAERALPDGRVTRVVQARSGPVLAAAGVDASDVPAGTVLLLPADPDASARRLRASLAEHTGVRPAVVVTDTSGRPWRVGVSDFALGAAGLVVLDDVRGTVDRFGRPLEVTVRAVADEVAAAADLAKGKAAGTPVAVVRGLGRYVTTADGEGAAGCTRTGPSDWFGYGQVEAVRAALGVPPGQLPPPPIDPGADSPQDVAARVEALLAAARARGATLRRVAEWAETGRWVGQTGAPSSSPGGPMPTSGTDREAAVLVAERPWGGFLQLCANEPCTVKIITVQPGHRLSLQRHQNRDEMWQPLDVPMTVQVDDRTWTLGVGERVVVPAGSLHRLGNDTDRPGRVLELAFGDFDEADIERLEDDYARSPGTDRRG